MKPKLKRSLILVVVLGALVAAYVFVPEILVGAVKISMSGVWLVLALLEALKGGIKMSVVLHLFEWFIVGLLFYFVIHGWKKGSEVPKGSIKEWAYHVCNPISLGAPAGLLAITLLLGLLGWSGLSFWIIKWTLLLAFIYASGRYHIESCYWPSENESLALVNNWRGELGGIKLEKKFQYIPFWVFKVLRVRCNKIRKEFFLGAITGGAKTGKFLNRTLVAKVRVVLKFKLVDLSKAIGDYEVSEGDKDIAKEAIEALDQEVKDIFLTTFLETFRGYAYEKSLDERKELCEKAVKALKEPLEALGIEIKKDWVSLPAEIKVDGRLYDCLNRMSITDFETKEVFQKAEIGKKMGFRLEKIKGIKSDIVHYVFADPRMKNPENLSWPETVVKEEKLRTSTVREPFKLFLIWALLGLIILMGIIPLGFIGYSKFGPANSPKQEASVESVVPAANITIPANPSGPSGTVGSPFDKYHIPGFPEGILFWGAALSLVVVALVNLSKKVPETYWLKKYRLPVMSICFMMIFFGIFSQGLPKLGGVAVLVMIISLIIYTNIERKTLANRILSGIMGLVILYLIVDILIVPFVGYTLDAQHPTFYKEQIREGKLFEGFKKFFDKPQSQMSNRTVRQLTQPVVRPKQVVQQIVPKRIERTKVQKFRISARRSWTRTVCFKGGEKIRVVAKGTWDGSGSDAVEPDLLCGPEGIIPPKWVEDLSPYPYHGGRIHELLGKIGQGRPFSVGSSYEGVVESPGGFYLGMNDWKVSDNDGCLEVTIEVVR